MALDFECTAPSPIPMKLRAKLIAAFLILAAVPLTAVVLYSYTNSKRLFERAVETETRELAESLVTRLETVRDDLDERLKGLGDLPIRTLIAPEEVPEGEIGRVYSELMEQIDEVSSLVESLEFTPVGPRVGDADWIAPGAAGSRDWGGAPITPTERTYVIYPSRTLADALRRLLKHHQGGLSGIGLSRHYLTSTLGHAVRRRSEMDRDEIEALESHARQGRELLGTEFDTPVRRDGEIVGYIRAHVRVYPIIRQILAQTRREPGDLPFAVDGQRKIYLAEPSDRDRLAEIRPLGTANSADARPLSTSTTRAGWIVAEAPYPASDLTFSIARPIGDSLQDLRQTAVNNFTAGLLAITLALVGIVILSGRMTRNLTILTAGAESLATGNLQTRVPLHSSDEFGMLAAAFNRMAGQLSHNQEQLLEQQLQQRLLAAENERKGHELEEARQFQLSLLPKQVPNHATVTLAVHMQTATEVGGDYYDFLEVPNGDLVAAIGDATGHGAAPGTLVTVIKGLFSAAADDGEPVQFLSRATRTIRRMDLGRMQMALTLVRVAGRRMSISAAGMPPALLHRQRQRSIEEIALRGMPLGGLIDFAYQQWQAEVEAGDTLLLMTDGFPELANAQRDPLGYDRVKEIFAACADSALGEILATLDREAVAWRGPHPLEDDITFMLLRIK